jgi:hypothetical protein
MPLQETSGNLTTDAFGGGVAVVPNYIEDVFSTWLYTGTGATQSIVNNIDLSTKGGLVWIKSRSAATDHKLTDTARGATKALISDTDGAQTTDTTGLTAFGTTGFTIGADSNYNTSAATYTSWTFRKQPKFFDVVTFSGNGGTQNIAHNLGSVPGCVIVKFVSGAAGVGNWPTWHRGLSSGYLINLNLTGGEGGPNSNYFGNNTTPVDPTSTQFTVGSNPNINGSGSNYVAYLFAHNAGGFGLTGTDNVISCGSWTGDATFNGSKSINLGWEPQFLLYKNASASTDWVIEDTMRGMPVSGADGKLLYPNLASAEVATTTQAPNATGFSLYADNSSGNTYIYIAIRRGPMKVPTTGTSVYNGITRTGTGAAASITGVGFTPDFIMARGRTGGFESMVVDRLRGNTQFVKTDSTSAEGTLSAGGAGTVGFTLMDGMGIGTYIYWNDSGTPFINHFFKRAPSFFDEVCYAGSGSVTTQAHNLGAVPEMMIHKARGGTTNAGWAVYVSSLGAGNTLTLNNTNGVSSSPNNWNSTAPTSSVFTVGTSSSGETNYSGTNYVAYLFATLAGVSKVGTYTGNGTTQAISCGFTGGARFVLIKRTDAAGDWYVYDTARGMTTLTDPYLLLDDTAAETATLGSVTTTAGGFTLNASILSAINTNAATYIFLAIA